MLRTKSSARAGLLLGTLLCAAVSWVPTAHSAPSVGPAAVFDVTDFGAVGDGVADDAPAFRSAIAAADGAAGTNTVFIPAGTYLMDADGNGTPGVVELHDVANVAVVGAGTASIVKYKARNWTAQSDPHLFACDGCAFVSFTDLAVDGSKNDTGFVGQERMHAIQLLNSHDITVQRLTVTDNFGDGVEVLGEPGITENVTISDSEFIDGGRSGIGVQGGTRQMEFVDNHFQGGSDQDIDFEPTGSLGGRPAPEDILIQGNTIEHSTAAFSVTIGGQLSTNRAARIQFIDNTVTNGVVQLFNTDDVLVEGNTITSTVSRPGSLVRVEGATSGTTVRDNTIDSVTPDRAAIEVIPHNAKLPAGVTIELNRIHQNAANDGVLVEQATGPVVVRENEITGSGAGEGVRYRLSLNDGIVRADADVSDNTVDGFTQAGIGLHASGTGSFGLAAVCRNQVSGPPLGLRIELASPASLTEVTVCDNVWASEVTTPVRTDKVTHLRGTGSPEGVVAAPVGSDFIRTDEGSRRYDKLSGSGLTGWVAS